LHIFSEAFVNTDIINAYDNHFFVIIFNDLMMNIKLSFFYFFIMIASLLSECVVETHQIINLVFHFLA